MADNTITHHHHLPTQMYVGRSAFLLVIGPDVLRLLLASFQPARSCTLGALLVFCLCIHSHSFLCPGLKSPKLNEFCLTDAAEIVDVRN